MVDVSGGSFSASGRGWSDRALLLAGVAVLAILGLVTGLLLAKSKGYLEDTVKVDAQLMNVGDGLPERADVKFRGMLVGAVTSVTPAEDGKPNIVHIDLKSEHAGGIPSTVTARVVPSNVFAVSSVQLVDNGDGAGIRNGAIITEDTKLPTVLFQTTTNKLRQVLAATERQRGDPPVGLIGVFGEATQGRGNKLLSSGARLQAILTEFNAMVTASPNDPSTIAALEKVSDALSTTSPRLLDNLENALVPLRTLAQKKDDVRGLLSAGLHTTGTTATAIDNHIDQMIGIGTHLTPVVGVLAQNADKFVPIATRVRALSDAAFANGWDPGRQVIGLNLILSFSPAWTYVRDDCPRYGELAGPSCTTAPETRRASGSTFPRCCSPVVTSRRRISRRLRGRSSRRPRPTSCCTARAPTRRKSTGPRTRCCRRSDRRPTRRLRQWRRPRSAETSGRWAARSSASSSARRWAAMPAPRSSCSLVRWPAEPRSRSAVTSRQLMRPNQIRHSSTRAREADDEELPGRGHRAVVIRRVRHRRDNPGVRHPAPRHHRVDQELHRDLHRCHWCASGRRCAHRGCAGGPC
ncbi:putative Mce family protein [Mycobacteroides abscessus M94]|nr:putative Mce family protein [Mycobacteroides abscessus M94]